MIEQRGGIDAAHEAALSRRIVELGTRVGQEPPIKPLMNGQRRQRFLGEVEKGQAAGADGDLRSNERE